MANHCFNKLLEFAFIGCCVRIADFVQPSAKLDLMTDLCGAVVFASLSDILP
jgi:hypothetical protein